MFYPTSILQHVLKAEDTCFNCFHEDCMFLSVCPVYFYVKWLKITFRLFFFFFSLLKFRSASSFLFCELKGHLNVALTPRTAGSYVASLKGAKKWDTSASCIEDLAAFNCFLESCLKHKTNLI